LALQATDDAQILAAVELVERVVERAGGDVDDLNFMAFTLAERGLRPKQALLFAWRAVLLEPLSGSVVDTLGWAQLKAGDVDGAAVALRRAVRLSPNEGEIWFHLAAAELARGDRHAASEAIERALALLPLTDPIRARAAALLSAP
jgi:Flp pilus assembly protein TadD